MKRILILGLSIAMVSCSSEMEEVKKPLDVSQQSLSLHSIMKAKETANILFSATATRGLIGQTEYPYDEMANGMEERLERAVVDDVHTMLKEQGYREALADAMYDYCNGVSLEELVPLYQITEGELQLIANACACIDYVNQEDLNIDTRGKSRDAVSCTVAVASSVACTISAIGITTPVGLGVFLVSKALATVSLSMYASR